MGSAKPPSDDESWLFTSSPHHNIGQSIGVEGSDEDHTLEWTVITMIRQITLDINQLKRQICHILGYAKVEENEGADLAARVATEGGLAEMEFP